MSVAVQHVGGGQRIVIPPETTRSGLLDSVFHIFLRAVGKPVPKKVAFACDPFACDCWCCCGLCTPWNIYVPCGCCSYIECC
jgi:hypothetical protein